MKRKCLISLMLLAAVSMAACGKAEKEAHSCPPERPGALIRFIVKRIWEGCLYKPKVFPGRRPHVGGVFPGRAVSGCAGSGCL